MKDIFLVDADDTILDFHKASNLAIKDAFEKGQVPWQESFADAYKKINDGLWLQLEKREITREELIESRFSIYLKYVNVDIDANSFNQNYLTYLATHPIFVDGAQEFLKKLNGLGRVFIVTNGTWRIQKSRFDICGLWDYAEDVFVSQRVGFDKPAKGYTEYVESHIPEYKKERAVWIGDSLSADIKAANEANITSIWFNPTKKANTGDIKPNYIAQNFEEVLKVVKIL